MADEYLDVISFRKRGDKPYAHKIGSAKANGKGGWNVYLDSLPLPDQDGRVSLLISPRQDKGSLGGSKAPSRPAPRRDEMGDEIPF